MRKSIVTQILVNAIILVGAWAGLMVMNNMANAENAARVTTYHAEQRAAAEAMVKAQLEAKKAEFKRCTTEPFLTNHVLVIGSEIAGTFDTGVVYDVTLAKALSVSDKYVLAYCE